MKTRVSKFAPNGFYSLCGESSANSLFFENATDQILFFELLDRFLGEVIVVHGYSTNPTGWKLLFSVKDAKTIKSVYRKLKAKSKKVKKQSLEIKPADMMVEHFRYFLSAYVKQSNFIHKRHGSRVHSKMEKCVFESLEDLLLEKEEMRQMKSSKVQKPKYRPNMAYYLVEKQLSRMSVWRHSMVGLGGEKLVRAVLPCFRWIFDKADILRQLIQNTWNLHFGPDSSNNQLPKLE